VNYRIEPTDKSPQDNSSGLYAPFVGIVTLIVRSDQQELTPIATLVITEVIGVDDVRAAFWASFWSASRSLTQARDAMLERHGVVGGQHAVLVRLWAADDQTPTELGRSLDLSTSAVTGIVTKMESAGLVERRLADNHVILRLTRRGRDLEKILDREMRTLGERALGSLDDAHRIELIRMLRELRANTAGA
jgi:MarR family transcriptional regulator, organic hydroperoxide resistance regulator